MRAILYSRVSTDAQERDGTSLATQERACAEFAESQHWLVTDAIRDTASGFSLERPGIERVRQAVRKGHVDVVVAYAVDRLSRNQNHIGVIFDELEQHQTKLQFVTENFEDTAIGRFILAARAFIAEIEREKISERTMRGKLERAHSGRLPQGTGKGIYGYLYDPTTGRREINSGQAVVVRRIFRRYAETKSFSAVSNELNADGISAFMGGRWYPLTVRAVLKNRAYSGVTVYRRTRRTKMRGRPSRVTERDPADWIEIDGVSPRIIDEELWNRVQEILDDPERLRRRPEGRAYLLGGRARCSICGSSMVGQTLASKGRSYRYYRCRHVYDRNTGRQCSAKYIRADALESAVWHEVERVLTHPDVVLNELTLDRPESFAAELQDLEQALEAASEKQKRLVRLFSTGDVEESIARDELRALGAERSTLEREHRLRMQAAREPVVPVDRVHLNETCSEILGWLRAATPADRGLALEALQVVVTAERGTATVAGILPGDVPSLVSDEDTSRCSSSGDKPNGIRDSLPGRGGLSRAAGATEDSSLI